MMNLRGKDSLKVNLIDLFDLFFFLIAFWIKNDGLFTSIIDFNLSKTFNLSKNTIMIKGHQSI